MVPPLLVAVISLALFMSFPTSIYLYDRYVCGNKDATFPEMGSKWDGGGG
jgi:hypothetical protein